MRLESLLHALRFAIRGLAREPAHSAVAIAILAIGIGANTAVFSVVNPLVLKPLPFRDADRLVWIANTGRGEGLSGKTYRVAAYEELARSNRAFEAMSAYFAFFGYFSYTLTGQGDPERLMGVQIAPGFLELLGVQPQLGRGFAGDEWALNGPQAMLISAGLWQRRFGADPAIVGKAVSINGLTYTVVGVLPDGFDFASTFTPGTRVEMLVPARLEEMRDWGNTLAIIGRLRPGVTIDQARAEFATLLPPIAKSLDYTFGTDLRSLKEHVSGSMRRALLVLWAAVGLVLLLVCTNLSNLLLARTASRSKEFAVRLALGSSRARIVMQLVVEGVVLAACGAIIGIPLAYLLTRVVTSSATLAVPLLHEVRVDGMAMAITALAAVVAGVAVGAVPALRVAARPPLDALKAQGRGTTDGRHHAHLRSTLVVVEVALASVLLVGAGLLLRSFVHILDVDLGFQPARATALKLEVFSQLEPEARRARLFAAARRAAEIPGVEAAGLTDALPLDRNRTWGVGVPGQVYPDGQYPMAFVYVTGPGYFRAMGIPIMKGRDFSEHDAANGAAVGILNQSLARQLYGTREPIGQTAQTGDTRFTVVGVVADVRQSSLDEAAATQMYMPFGLSGGLSSDLIVRSTLPPASLVATARAALAEIDRSMSIVEVRPLTELVERAVSPRKFLLSLLAAFAGVGLLLASLGIYGVISYGVAQRVQEIGVRMALGATARSLRGLVLWETLRLAVAGIAIGLLASLALARLIAALLYETSPADPITFVATGALLVTVAAIAGYVPALRASRVDPITALRAE